MNPRFPTQRTLAGLAAAALLAACGGSGGGGGGNGTTAPAITQHPAGVTVTVGDPATFTVAATGTAPLAYQWQMGGADIPGATGTSYTTPAALLGDSGASFRVVVSNSAGSATSNPAVLTVTPAAGSNFRDGVCAGGSAARTWCFVEPTPHTFSFTAVRFVDPLTVYTTADGILVRSLDGGVTWQHNAGYAPLAGLGDPEFPAAGVAVLAGEVLRRSTNAGSTLTIVRAEAFEAVEFATALVGVAVGGAGAVRTTDGGATWNPVTASGADVDFVDASVGVAVGAGGAILRTVDGGAGWAPVTSDTTEDLASVHFSGATGVAVGQGGALVRSVDGGASWDPVASGTTENLRGVRFASPTVVVAVGELGTIVRSIDAGATWDPAATPILTYTLEAVDFASATAGLAVGEEGALLRTADGGETWTGFSPDRHQGGAFLSFGSPTAGVAVGGYGRADWTADGGLTWSPGEATWTGEAHAVAMASATVAIAATDEGLHRSTDGGKSFALVAGTAGAEFEGVAFASADEGVAVGVTDGGDVRRTVNGGESWDVVDTGNADILMGVAFSGKTGVAVGFSGRILRTTDGGESWDPVTSGTTELLKHVTFATSTDVYASGSNGGSGQVFLRSIDGGLTWDPVVLGGFTGDLGPIRFWDASHGVLIRSGREAAFHTSNGGVDWVNRAINGSNLPLTGGFTDLAFLSATEVVGAVGNGGLLRTATGVPGL